MKEFFYKTWMVLFFNAAVITMSFIFWGWVWGCVNILAAIAGFAIGVGLPRRVSSESEKEE